MRDESERLLQWLCILIWVITPFHFVAQTQFWYWTYKWLDVPMHFLGGVWMGLAALWLWKYSGFVRQSFLLSPMAVALVGGLVLGVFWEVYELVMRIFHGTELPANYIADSLLDLLMDVLGAMSAYVAFARTRSTSVKNIPGET